MEKERANATMARRFAVRSSPVLLFARTACPTTPRRSRSRPGNKALAALRADAGTTPQQPHPARHIPGNKQHPTPTAPAPPLQRTPAAGSIHARSARNTPSHPSVPVSFLATSSTAAKASSQSAATPQHPARATSPATSSTGSKPAPRQRPRQQPRPSGTSGPSRPFHLDFVRARCSKKE